jgi:hypothetical protein
MKCKVLFCLISFVFCLPYTCYGETIELKNPNAATGLSLGSTLLPSLPLLFCLAADKPFPSAFLLSASGIIVGPSVGHFYAGNRSRGMKSIGFRSVCTLTGLLGAFGVYGSVQSEHWGAVDGWVTLSVVSGIAIFGSALFDICTCPSSVKKYNESVRNSSGLYLNPEINITEKSYGLTIGYRF